LKTFQCAKNKRIQEKWKIDLKKSWGSGVKLLIGLRKVERE